MSFLLLYSSYKRRPLLPLLYRDGNELDCSWTIESSDRMSSWGLRASNRTICRNWTISCERVPRSDYMYFVALLSLVDDYLAPFSVLKIWTLSNKTLENYVNSNLHEFHQCPIAFSLAAASNNKAVVRLEWRTKIIHKWDSIIVINV